MTPNIAIVHVSNPYWSGIHLWIPLFLLWIPALLLAPLVFLILLPVCFLARISLWRVIGVSWGILCGLPGTDVRVVAEGQRIVVKLL
jgi:hypothetical protein